EGAVAPRDLEQALGLEPLLPERRPLPRAPARDQERSGGVLPEPGAEESAAAELADHEILDLARVEEDLICRRGCVRIGKGEREARVRRDRWHLEAERLGGARPEWERPGRVPAPAEGREDAEPPVSDLVAEPLDDDRPVRGDCAGGRSLLTEE